MTRFGMGYDVHRLVEGRKLILGGVEIPWEKGLLGHSDADVLTHALMDALLGAAALGDIGHLFPDNDPRYEGADSVALLREVVREESGNGAVLMILADILDAVREGKEITVDGYTLGKTVQRSMAMSARASGIA